MIEGARKMSHTQPNPRFALAPRTVLCLRSGGQRPGANESGRYAVI